MSNEHNCAVADTDDEGFFFGECACGFRTPPLPDLDLLIDEMMDHAIAVTR